MSGVKRKHVTLSLNEKLAALRQLKIGNRKGIESYTVAIDSENALRNRKTLRKPKLELLDNTLWMWFCQERRKGTPISGPIIKEKAIALHKKVEAESEFAVSEGWIDRWKTRHGVRFVSISGEKLSADAEAAKEFSVKFQEIVEENELLPWQVYNIDETGLNYKMLPNKTLAASNETVAGTKLIKDRLTIAPCSNGDGSHKLPLFVIGKYKKPRAFKNINLSSLPDYHLFKSWFFGEFVPSVEKDLKQKKLPVRVLLLLDNALSHPSEEDLVKGDIKAIFLPPNVTSLIQPMDQGVIEWLKRRYRRKYISSILEKSEEGCNIFEAMKSLNIKDVIYTIAESWEELKPDTLRKSWHLQTVQVNVPANEVEEWIAQCDEDCETSEELNDDEIIAAVLENNSEETVNEDSDGDNDKPPTPTPRTLLILPLTMKLSHKEMHVAIKQTGFKAAIENLTVGEVFRIIFRLPSNK
ncbi:hypothetical protein ILUMI_06064 [Ignelater luminosus]|uniref:HTH CENPB-type domain-containing protein n=1 Tax=Ignelater luminosus TaxID=2038154 RepID=A0A8K0DBE8_IGNLU|nr:hypothetical protein ILUMI_06064 [Ignelater luminosus]